jgi:hypothetical protein
MAAGLAVPQKERQKEVPVRKNGVLLEYREIHENHFGDHTKAGAFEACGPLPSRSNTHTHTHTNAWFTQSDRTNRYQLQMAVSRLE